MDLARSLGIQGTPTFRINGAAVIGSQPPKVFEEVIERELVAVQKLTSRGLAGVEAYTLRVEANRNQSPDGEPEEPLLQVPVAGSPTLGPDDAVVTVVEFSEFQCPFCKRVQPTLARLRKRFPNDVRIVFKHLPLDFHEHALPAARIAALLHQERGNAGFWQLVPDLFDSQLDETSLIELAASRGVSPVKARQALDGELAADRIDDDLNLADDLGVRGTPHFFINGRRLVGARPYDEFEQMVLAAMVEAKSSLAAGVAPAEYYDQLMKGASNLHGPKRVEVALASDGRPTLGPESAPVAVHVFSDFECAYCARVEPTIDRLRESFPAKLRIVWHNLPLPFHERARSAAAAGLEAHAQKGDATFWKMHQALFSSHSLEDGPRLDRSDLIAHARVLSLDIGRFKQALDDGRHQAAIDADLELAKAAGLDGTPSFVIDGWKTSGARPLRHFKRLVTRALHRRTDPNSVDHR
jgi:protein-disulfide isomerase